MSRMDSSPKFFLLFFCRPICWLSTTRDCITFDGEFKYLRSFSSENRSNYGELEQKKAQKPKQNHDHVCENQPINSQDTITKEKKQNSQWSGHNE